MTPDGKTRRQSPREWLEARLNLTEIFSLLTSFGLFPAELDARRPLREAIDEALSRPIPSYARWPRVLGILSVLLFGLLVVTGVMLAFYYQPTVSEAYGSVTTIVRDVAFGWFVHQIHQWGACLLLLILLVRIGRFYFQGLYKTPREAIWIVAVLAFFVAAHADLTGRLLPWDTRGYWTTIRGLEILTTLPVLGPLFAFLVGGREVDSLVLLRFYLLHVAILPALLLLLFYLGFSSVRRVGLSDAPGPRRSGATLLRTQLYDLLILTVLVFGCLVTLATLVPAPFAQPADAFSTPPDAKPSWYLLAPHAFLELFPSLVPRSIRGLILEALLAAAVLLPFIGRSPGRPARERRVAIAAGVVVLALWILLTWYGYRLETGR